MSRSGIVDFRDAGGGEGGGCSRPTRWMELQRYDRLVFLSSGPAERVASEVRPDSDVKLSITFVTQRLVLRSKHRNRSNSQVSGQESVTSVATPES